MKKIFWIITLIITLGSNLVADAIIGVEYISSRNTFEMNWINKIYESKNNSTALKINFGGGNKYNNTIFQTYVLFEEYEDGIYAEKEANKYTEYGVEFIKGIEVYDNIAPYIKLGLGAGNYDYSYTNDATQDGKLFSWNVKAGLGIMYKFGMFDIHAGLDYQYKPWEDIVYPSPINETLEIKEKSLKMYIGANIWF